LSEHVADYLPELALGVLDAALEERVVSHLAGCPSCATWLKELRAAAPAPAGSEDNRTPPAEAQPMPLAMLALRTVSVLRTPIHRFRDARTGELRRFTGRFAELFAMPASHAAQLLAEVESGPRWLPGPVAGIELFPVPSPLEGALSVVVRAEPGAVFPRHRHTGDEWTLVLQGGLESNGHGYWRGERLSQRAGSVHTLVALPGATCLCAVRLMGEMEFG
jgi:putative transcriptional regulator